MLMLTLMPLSLDLVALFLSFDSITLNLARLLDATLLLKSLDASLLLDASPSWSHLESQLSPPSFALFLVDCDCNCILSRNISDAFFFAVFRTPL